MVENLTQHVIIAKKPIVAKAFWTRSLGMMFRKFDSFDAMIFPNCRAIHTFFMTQPLDIIFANSKKQVVGFESNVSPWRMIFGPREATTVIELPAGHLCGIPLNTNDLLTW